MNRLYQISFTCFLLLYVTDSAAAQLDKLFPTLKSDEIIHAKPTRCWENQMRLSDIVQRLPAEKSLIVIARSGDKDRKADLNGRRLNNVRAYLTVGVAEESRLPPGSVIIAEGESTIGYGRIDIYLEGRLIEVLMAYPNIDLAVEGCYDWIDGQDGCVTARQKLFYPCKDEVNKKRQKQKPAPKRRNAK